MKKIIITVAFAAFAMASHAQLFVGGQIGYNTNGGKIDPREGDDTKTTRTTTINITPFAGYQMSEKLAVGARLNYSTTKTTQYNFVGTDNRVTKSPLMGLDLFGQYTCVEFEKFFIYAEVELGFEFGKDRIKTGSNTANGDKNFNYGINIRPVLAYGLSEKIDLICNLNFLGIGYNSDASTTPEITTPTGTTTGGDKTVTNRFGFNVNADNAATLGAITVGFRYKL